jgi:hypothetical protein
MLTRLSAAKSRKHQRLNLAKGVQNPRGRPKSLIIEEDNEKFQVAANAAVADDEAREDKGSMECKRKVDHVHNSDDVVNRLDTEAKGAVKEQRKEIMVDDILVTNPQKTKKTRLSVEDFALVDW